MRRLTTTLCVAVTVLSGLASLAVAQDLPNQRTAQKMLFKTGRNATEVRILHPELVPEAYQTALQQAAKVQKYFEALAVSPTEGMTAKSSAMALNFHSAEAAHKAAIAGCNLKKAKKSADCVVVADFLPKGYSGPAAFSLSYNATEEFAKAYKRGNKSKAFAVSPASGNWGQAVGATDGTSAKAAAVADCNAKPGSQGDCVVVSTD